MNQRSKVSNTGPAVDPDVAMIAEVARMIERRQAEAARREAQASATATAAESVPAVVAAVAQTFDPLAQKQRLLVTLRGLVNDPCTADWLFGFAADMLVFHAQSPRDDASAIYGRMQGLIGELRQIRDAQSQRGQVQGPRGKWFNIRVLAIAKQFGIPTPRELRAQRMREAVEVTS